MARPPRIEYEDAFYHVTSRGNARNRIFLDDFDREMFLEIVGAAHQRFGFIIHAFVLMDNHYHLLVQTPQPNLSASMRDINGIYTQAFNRRHKHVGHLFQGRFKPIVVNRDEHYLELIRYIHLNPLRAQMMKRLDQFNYSSHKAIVARKWARKWEAWYDRKTVLKQFGKRESSALKAYREFVVAGEGKESPLKDVIGGYALGDRNFADWLWTKFIEGKDEREIVGARQLKPQLDTAKVMGAVGRYLEVAEEDIFGSRKGRLGENRARGMVLYILSRHTGLTHKEIGNQCGDLSRMAVSVAVHRFELSLSKDEELARLLGSVISSLGL